MNYTFTTDRNGYATVMAICEDTQPYLDWGVKRGTDEKGKNKYEISQPCGITRETFERVIARLERIFSV